MKKINKQKFAALAVTAVLAGAQGVSAAGTLQEAPAEAAAEYFSKTGIVNEISNYDETGNSGGSYIGIVGEGDEITRFVVTPDTVFIGEDELASGVEITGFYYAKGPAVLIYPPQYFAAVIAVSEEGRTVKADLFDDSLVSADGWLKLNIADTTEILTHDGQPYDGSLANKRLAVVYGPSTRSVPAQTTPEKVIVLPDPVGAQTGAAVQSEEVRTSLHVQADVFNSGQELMIPIRAVAEALGLDVLWNDSLKAVTVSNGSAVDGYTVYVNSDMCEFKGETLTMPAPVVLRDGRTYAAASFVESLSGLTVTANDGRITLNP
ncbi:MAG: copper amine oxidase N-terminal domain-containing protein [Clostridiales bacterium]|jgi:hypothetical protein|nr:copper amine oxidase N-terminal domain-containing protein [Clostridiales bacterium]